MSKHQRQKEKTQAEKYYKKPADFNYLEQYKISVVKEIGRGGYGVVYKALDQAFNNLQYACKINFGIISRQIVYTQIAFLELVNGKKHLPNLKNVIVHKQVVHIFIKYFHHKPFITLFSSFSLQDIKHYLFQLLLGLKDLKQLGIYHRDIKPGNFLYNPDKKRGIIVDFGLAELDKQYFDKLVVRAKEFRNRLRSGKMWIDEQSKKFCQKFTYYERIMKGSGLVGRNKIGTQNYMPLQSTLHHQSQSYSSDIWPVGVIMLQFALRKYTIFNPMKLPHSDKQLRNPYLPINILQLCTLFGTEQVQNQCKNFGYELEVPKDIKKIDLDQFIAVPNFDEDAKNLLFRLLDLNPLTRITVQSAISHSFFDSVRAMHE